MSSFQILEQSDITQIQQHFYRIAAETELDSGEPYEYNGVKFPNLLPYSVGPSSKFDILGFARAIEARTLEKLKEHHDVKLRTI